MKVGLSLSKEIKPGQFWQPISFFRPQRKGGYKKKSLKEILEETACSLAAMANAGGGEVTLGLSPAGEPEEILFTQRSWPIFLSHLNNFFSPPLNIKATFPETEGKKFICLSVDPSPEIICLRPGKAFLRVDGRNIPLSQAKIKTLKETRLETWHEREVLTKSSLADLDESLLAQFWGKSLSLAEAEKILYRPYGLIAYHHGTPLLTRAALYLWAKDPWRWHARPGLEFIRLEGSTKEEGPNYNIKERIRLEAPILRIIAELNDFIDQHIQERVIRQDLFFKEKFVYPVAALKEVIINALAHRDYSLEGRAIEVYMYDDRLEVLSPGGLPGFLKIDHLQERKGMHYARNPLIVRVLTDMGIMHSVGQGFSTIFKEMQKNGLNPPEVKVSGNCFQVVLRNAPLMDESTLLWLKNFKTHLLNSRQIRILAYARAHGLIFSSADYQKLGVDRDTAYVEIKELINKGIVKQLKRHGKIYQIIEPGRT